MYQEGVEEIGGLGAMTWQQKVIGYEDVWPPANQSPSFNSLHQFSACFWLHLLVVGWNGGKEGRVFTVEILYPDTTQKNNRLSVS